MSSSLISRDVLFSLFIFVLLISFPIINLSAQLKGGENFEEATPLSPGEHKGGEIDPGEVQFFMVKNIKPGQELYVKIRLSPKKSFPGSSLHINLYDWDGDLLESLYCPVTSLETYELAWFAGSDLSSHEIYFSIRCDGAYMSGANFDVTISISDHFDADSGRDAGDTLEDFLELPEGEGTYHGFIAVANNGYDEADCYKMTLNANQNLKVKLIPKNYRSSPLLYTLVLSIYDEDRNVVAESVSMQMDEILNVEWTSPKRQDVYIKVHSSTGFSVGEVICDYDLQIKLGEGQAQTSPSPTPPIMSPTTTPSPSTVPPTTAPPTISAPTGTGISLTEYVGIAVSIAVPISAWVVSKMRRSRLRVLMRKIEMTFREFKSNAAECEAALLSIREEAQRDLVKGRITEEQFALIDKRIEEYLEEVRKLQKKG